jgi:hypothetical protein
VTSVEQIIVGKKKIVEAGTSKWGPVVATRMSNRIVHDGKSIIEKAKELKKTRIWTNPKVYLMALRIPLLFLIM